MTDNLFHEIPDAQVVLRSKGVYRQAKLFRRGEHVFAAMGPGFVRLLTGGGTSVPTVAWQEGDVSAADQKLDLGQGTRRAPRWTA